jgi:hypothetical protein
MPKGNYKQTTTRLHELKKTIRNIEDVASTAEGLLIRLALVASLVVFLLYYLIRR